MSQGELGRQLGDRFRVVTYDRRGRGESGDGGTYAVEREIEDIGALLEHFGGHGFALGVSSGAVLALRAALAGLPIDGLACYEPPFVVSTDRDPVPGDYVERLDAVVAAGRPGDAVHIMMTEAVGLPAEMVAGMVDQPFWAMFEQIGHTVAYDGRIMDDTMRGRPDSLDVFAGVHTPTLVMSGGDSPAWLSIAAEQLAQRLSAGTLTVLPGQTHQVDSAALGAAVGQYFQSLVTTR
ncbi:alpha/beta fold hydrolase [Tomitella biformata]|uniref:alpha/beta fold hydrolase n=1 Tax=Tomitella biformata TaxID=630403 RepID=UPI001906ADD0|nr:alpha/beta hydrolase [Tomitella biformata]